MPADEYTVRTPSQPWRVLIIFGEAASRSLSVVAPQGFEPRYAAPEAAVLPLNEGAIQEHPDGRSRLLHSFDDMVSSGCGQTAGPSKPEPACYNKSCENTCPVSCATPSRASIVQART